MAYFAESWRVDDGAIESAFRRAAEDLSLATAPAVPHVCVPHPEMYTQLGQPTPVSC
jgi:hypothetical protein